MRQRIHGRKFRQERRQNSQHRKRRPRRKARRAARRPASGMGAVRRARGQWWQAPDLCFDRLLPCPLVQEAIVRSGLVFRERLYTPLMTLWTFLYQVLCPDRPDRV